MLVKESVLSFLCEAIIAQHEGQKHVLMRKIVRGFLLVTTMQGLRSEWLTYPSQ